jgi:hypothetical protein
MFSLLARCLGLLLLTAAGLKVYGFGVDPVARLGIFSAPAVQFLVIVFEILLGLWLVSGVQPLGAWAAALSTFLVFASVSFYQGWIGQASCGCLGAKVSVNPWIMFTLDLAAIAALLLARPDLQPLWVHRARILSVGAGVLGVYLLLLGAAAGFAHVRYGSIDAAVADLRGERLSVRPSLVDVGQGAPGETRAVNMELTNRTQKPISIFGGTTDCSCSVLGDLPVTVLPGETKTISIQVRLPSSEGIFTRRAELLIDDNGFQRVGIRLTGRIRRDGEILDGNQVE